MDHGLALTGTDAAAKALESLWKRLQFILNIAIPDATKAFSGSLWTNATDA